MRNLLANEAKKPKPAPAKPKSQDEDENESESGKEEKTPSWVKELRDELKALREEKKALAIADRFKNKFSDEAFKNVPEKVWKKFIPKSEEEIDSAATEAMELYNDLMGIKQETDENTRQDSFVIPVPPKATGGSGEVG